MKTLKHLLFIIIGVLLVFGVLGFYLAPRDKLKPADAIVAISGGDTEARTRQAIRIYEEGYSKKLILAGAASDPNSSSNAAVMRRLAVSEGVSETDILLEENSRDTKENAIQVAKTFASPPKTIILVTSPYHQRRANIEFQRAFPDTEIINSPAFDDIWRRSLWWVTPWGWYLSLSELFKIVVLSTQGY